jgi:hypothetical protein
LSIGRVDGAHIENIATAFFANTATQNKLDAFTHRDQPRAFIVEFAIRL